MSLGIVVVTLILINLINWTRARCKFYTRSWLKMHITVFTCNGMKMVFWEIKMRFAKKKYRRFSRDAIRYLPFLFFFLIQLNDNTAVISILYSLFSDCVFIIFMHCTIAAITFCAFVTRRCSSNNYKNAFNNITTTLWV